MMRFGEAHVRWAGHHTFLEGEVVWLRGPNGAGKTTMLRALAGLPTHVPVTARIDGTDPRRIPARELVRRVGWIPADARDGLVGLTVAGEARLRDAPPVAWRAHQDVTSLSLGEARRLIVSITEAPLLLLDEPLDGLDRAHAEIVLRRIADHDGTVVMAGHDARLERVATRQVDLAPADPRPVEAFFPRSKGPRLIASAESVRLGDVHLDLPAIDVGPGVHLLRGPNGSGKTTLLRHLAGLDPSDAAWNGSGVRPGRDTAWLPDRAADLLGAPTVGEEAQLSLTPPGLAFRHPLTLSRGEQQRLALDKVLSHPAPVLLLDEPEAHMDEEGRRAMFDAVARRALRGPVVVASHDPAWVHAGAEVVG